MPAQAGIQFFVFLDSRFRGNDKNKDAAGSHRRRFFYWYTNKKDKKSRQKKIFDKKSFCVNYSPDSFTETQNGICGRQRFKTYPRLRFS